MRVCLFRHSREPDKVISLATPSSPRTRCAASDPQGQATGSIASRSHFTVSLASAAVLSMVRLHAGFRLETMTRGNIRLKKATCVRMMFSPDITKARTVLDWEPRVPLEEGLSRTIEYFRGTGRSKRTDPAPESTPDQHGDAPLGDQLPGGAHRHPAAHERTSSSGPAHCVSAPDRTFTPGVRMVVPFVLTAAITQEAASFYERVRSGQST